MNKMRDCAKIIQKALEEGRSTLLVNEAQQVCSLHNIPTPKSAMASDVQEAILSASDVGFPVALKIVSPQIVHKSDVGGVLLNVRDEQELAFQFKKMTTEVGRREPSAKILGVFVEKMMPSSTEVIIGGIRDRQFGPSVMFGIGGVFAEIYNDAAFRIAPIDRVDASNLIRSLKGSRILEGIRGKPSADLDSLIDVLISVSNLVLEHEEISQLDLNPVIVYPDSVCAVDFRIVIGKRDGGK